MWAKKHLQVSDGNVYSVEYQGYNSVWGVGFRENSEASDHLAHLENIRSP